MRLRFVGPMKEVPMPSRTLRCLTVFFLATLLSALTTEAQVPVSVTVEVSDDQGTPLPGTRIRIGETTTGVTDDRGIYKTRLQLVPGSYEVVVQRAGFERSR